MSATRKTTPAKQTPMASKAEQLPEVPPVRDEAAELAAQLAATPDAAASAAAPPAAEPPLCESARATDDGLIECIKPSGHADLHEGFEGNTWSDVVSPDPEAIEGEIVNDTAPICQQNNHFPGGWKALRPDATSAVCAHGTWTR